MVAANRAGNESVPGEGRVRDHFGASDICAPTGEVVAQAVSKPWSAVSGDMDFSLLDEAERRINWCRDRRPEAYGFNSR